MFHRQSFKCSPENYGTVNPPRSCQTGKDVKIYTVLPEDKSRKDTFLAVDIGNTSIDAALLRNCGAPASLWEAGERVEIPLSEADGFADILSDSFRSPVTGGVIGSVAGDFTQIVAQAVESVFNFKPLVADCGMETGLEIAYENPRDLGIDRIANAAAVFAATGRDCMAVDLGTATTFDCVSSGGVYLGGAIAAGLGLFHKTLAREIPTLPQTPMEFPRSVMGSNTEDCIKSGTMFGYARMVDGMVRSLSSEMKRPPHVVATGGLAAFLSGEIETVSETDSLLTLKGLVIILRKNEKILSI